MTLDNKIKAQSDDKCRLLSDEVGCVSLEALPRDVSPREYYRGTLNNGKSVILMSYPDYDDEARLELKQFIRIDKWLSSIGVKVPEIISEQEDKGRLLLEDLGRISFGSAISWNKSDNDFKRDLYKLATDVLIQIRGNAPPDNFLPLYKNSKIRDNLRQIADYYIPFKRGSKMAGGCIQEYLAVWRGIESSLPPCPQGFLHADYHLENMMLIEGGSGISRCGLIDFQDALLGPLPYDLVNLLEDARVDVPSDISREMKKYYCRGMSRDEEEVFMLWYQVLSLQFHCRVIGLFIKLSLEQGRDEYLIHINRLQNYIKKEIENPLLSPIKDWFDKEGVDFMPIKNLNGVLVRKAFQNMPS